MTDDCDNVMVRDALPELAAGAIAAADAAAIRAHVDGCESCRAELLLIQTVRDRRGAVRTIDVASIVRALPAPPRREATVVDIASRRRRRSIPMQWRAAAAALLVGAGSLGVYAANRPTTPLSGAAAVARMPATPALPPATVIAARPDVEPSAPTTVARPTAAPALLIAGAAHDLASAQQRQLLKELEAFDGSLQEDPEIASYGVEEAGL